MTHSFNQFKRIDGTIQENTRRRNEAKKNNLTMALEKDGHAKLDTIA